MPNTVRQTVVTRKGDPYIYLWVMNEWYCYNPQEPPVGSGAMGDVYRGFRCKNGAPVAIKRVKDAYANSKMIRERARQEASLAFRHPNLVEMVGYCEYAPDSGPIFMISNFVQGENIDVFVKKLANSPNRVEKICNAMYSVLDALDYVHSRGVIHRDIKPSNIMVENDSNIRLMDLGIARMNGGNKFSAFGFIGTPEYSAPEQITREQNGTSVQINATTDIYALGITFYELLTGSNPMASNVEAETLTRQMKNPLPSSDLIPHKLMDVLWKATEKEQAKRYQTARAFREAIEASLLPDPPMSERIGQWLRQYWVLVTGIAVGLFVIISIIIIILIMLWN